MNIKDYSNWFRSVYWKGKEDKASKSYFQCWFFSRWRGQSDFSKWSGNIGWGKPFAWFWLFIDR